MKKIIILSLLTIIINPIITHAEATSSMRDNVLNRVRALKPEAREGIKEDQEENRTRIEDRKQLRTDIKKKLWSERIGIARARIGTIRGHITRLENVANRILQVVAIRENQGMDVSEARTYITQATTSLAEAKKQLENIIAQFPTEKTASTTPGTILSTIAHSLTSVVTLVKSAHEDLRSAWELLKEAPVSTASTTTSSL